MGNLKRLQIRFHCAPVSSIILRDFQLIIISGIFLCPNNFCGFAKIAALVLSKEIGKSLPRAHAEDNSKYKARVIIQTIYIIF